MTTSSKSPQVKNACLLSQRAYLNSLEHDGVLEVCIFNGQKPAQVGYFDDLDRAAQAILENDGSENCFLTLNPCNPALLARGCNRLVKTSYSRPVARTKDGDIVRENWFFLDIDPKRPSGVSASQEELDNAAIVAERVYDFLLSSGVPSESFIRATSGNGYYLLIRLPGYSVSEKSTETQKAFLNFLADTFSGDGIEIDRSVYNAARLAGAIGTVKVKGESIPQRPHRRSAVLTIAGAPFDPTKLQRCVPFDLYALAETIIPKPDPKEKAKSDPRTAAQTPREGAFDIRNFTHLLTGEKTTQRGITYYDCPACAGPTKLHIETATGRYGCFHIKAGTCSSEAIREALGQPKGAPKQETEAIAIRTVRLSDVEREEVSWLWLPRIPIGKVTILEGEEGLGKSWLICTLASIVSTGAALPDGSQVQQGNVLMLSAEDGLGDTIKPRLEAVDANCERIYAVDEPLTLDEKGFQKLELAIAQHQPVLVTIDPIFAYTGKVNANQAHESRGISSRLAEIAAKFQCAILIVRHIGKSKGLGEARAAGLGSIDWRAAARSVLLIGKDPADEAKRAIVQTKNNLEQLADALGFEICNGCFRWTGKSSLTAERILTTLSANDEDTQFKNDAVDFLTQMLEHGSVNAAEVEKARRKAGVSDYSLRQAKNKLRVKCHRSGFGKDGTWFWTLPDDETPSADCEHEKTASDKGVDSTAKTSKTLTQNKNQRLWVNYSAKSSSGNDLPKGVGGDKNQHLSAEDSTPLEGEEGEI
jgi:AAA domain